MDPVAKSILQFARLERLDALVRREMRNREVYTPPISAFRWWARRSHTLFGALVEAAEAALGPHLLVVDPFAGGGTTILEALRRGHRVYGQDINPWAARGMRAMLSLARVSPEAFEDAVDELTDAMASIVRRAYLVNGVWTTHVFRVATLTCPNCGSTIWLYPYAMLSLAGRRADEDQAWFGCQRCGSVTKGSRRDGARCEECGNRLSPDVMYLPGRQARCGHCGFSARVSSLVQREPLQYRMVLVERAEEDRRWLDKPTEADLAAAEGWPEAELPVGEIPAGKETAVLLRHGFRKWRDLYPTRQRAVLTELLKAVSRLRGDEKVREILIVAAVGTAEMAGLCSRWDRYYLKAYEATASHRFAFVPFTAEPNLWGNEISGRGTFIRRIRQIRKAISWFRRQKRVAEALGRPFSDAVSIVEGPSQRMALADGVADLVLTDPPYYGDVQYGELSSLFRAWLNLPTGPLEHEVVVDHRKKDGETYAQLLKEVLAEARRILRPEGRLVLTFHNRTSRAFEAMATALGEAGFRVVTWRWVASENERDFAKRDRTACTMDLVLECAPHPVPDAAPPGEPDPEDVEAHFLWVAGNALAAATNHQMSPSTVAATLRQHPFILDTAMSLVEAIRSRV